MSADKRLFTLSALMLTISGLLVSCGVRDGAPSSYHRDWDEIPDAVPKEEAHSKYGNPDSYEVFGKTYYEWKAAKVLNKRARLPGTAPSFMGAGHPAAKHTICMP